MRNWTSKPFFQWDLTRLSKSKINLKVFVVFVIIPLATLGIVNLLSNQNNGVSIVDTSDPPPTAVNSGIPYMTQPNTNAIPNRTQNEHERVYPTQQTPTQDEIRMGKENSKSHNWGCDTADERDNQISKKMSKADISW